MRIIGGLYRGRNISSPKGMTTRPTTDMVREALFNIVGIKVVDSYFLDIFAGTGAVGIEALSRGAQKAVFIEKDYNACKIIEKNLKDLQINDRAVLLKMDALIALKSLSKKGQTFDIIFMDPPYYRNLFTICIKQIQNYKLMKPNALLVVQHPLDESFEYLGFNCLKKKKYGKTVLTLLAEE